VRIFWLDADGNDTTVGVLGPGHLVGIAPLIGRATHHAFVEALTPVEADIFSARELLDRLPTDHALAGMVVGALAHRLAHAEALLRDVSLLPVIERIRNVELRLSAYPGVAASEISHVAMARIVHSRPETITRSLHRGEYGPSPQAPPRAPTVVPPNIELRFRPGERVLPDGVPPGHVAFIVDGEVQLAFASAERTIRFESLGPGDLFGLSALLGLPATQVDARATTAANVRLLDAAAVLGSLADQPIALAHVRVRLAQRLVAIERQIASIAGRHVTARLIDSLRSLALARGEPRSDGCRTLAISHADLARSIGARRETVTRALVALKSDGIIRRDGRKIVLRLSALPRRASRNAALS
jgi:CRP/FNR family cyclic AMP-dependent transcriptional regulator